MQHRRSRAVRRAAGGQRGGGNSDHTFDRMRSKVNREEAIGAAEGELLADDLGARLHALERAQKVDAMLREMKARKGVTA